MDSLHGAPDHAPDDAPDDAGAQVCCDRAGDAPIAPARKERRLQVRAYNLWAGMLGDRALPACTELGSGAWVEFAAYSVLVAADGTVRDPTIRYLGERLRTASGGGAPARASEVPEHSLLALVTDRVHQAIASQAPVSFESDLPGTGGTTFLCRGILLPFAGSDGAIGYVWGAINWKEVADDELGEALRRELGRALSPAPPRAQGTQIGEWADGPLGPDDMAFLACAIADAPCPSAGQYADARTLGAAALAAQGHARDALHAALGAAHDLACRGTLPDAALDTVFAGALSDDRLAAAAAVLAHARGLDVAIGALPALLAQTPGGMAAFAAGPGC